MAQYKNPALVMNVKALYPRLNQTYRFDRAAGDKGMSVPCDRAEEGAAYEMSFTMTKDQAVPLYKQMKKYYETERAANWPDMPSSTEVFDVDPDGNYTAKTKLKGSYGKDLVDPPLQYDSSNNLLPKDFMLTTGSTINCGMSLVPWQSPNGAGVSLRLKEVQVVKLEPLNARTQQSSFGVVDGGFKIADGFATSFEDDEPAPALSVVPDEPKPKEKVANAKDYNDIDSALDDLDFDD